MFLRKETNPATRDYLQELDLITKKPEDDNFTLNELDLSGNYLDEIKLKVDNVNQHYLINSLFYEKKTWKCRRTYTCGLG